MKYTVSFDIALKRHDYPGTFIALEGIDASGKTTQVAKLAHELTKKGNTVIPTHEPTDSVIGTLIREILAGKTEIPLVGFQYLFVADRVVHQEDIKNHLAAGSIVISHRYFWSGIPYGLTDKDGLDFENERELMLTAQSILSMYHQFIVPDYTFYLSVPVDTACERLAKMDKEKEIYEKKEKLEKIAKGYDWLMKQFPEEFTIIDGTQSEKEVTQAILSHIKEKE
jgi:dTMP kinase